MCSHRSSPDSGAYVAPSEFDVQAFADGALPVATVASVQKYLSANPREAHRVAFYERLNQEMRSAFEQPATRFDAPMIHRNRKRGIAGLSLFSLLLISMAIFAFDVSDTQLNNAATSAFLQVVRNSAVPLAAMPGVPDLRAVGFQPASTRIVRIGSVSHGNEVIYRNGLGEAVVLLSIPNWFNRQQPQWQAQRAGEQRLLAWTTPETRYVLAGKADTRGLMRAADLMTLHH